MSKRIGLAAFIKGSSKAAEQPGCANYDHHYNGCLFGKMCKVEQGQRCGYFEKAVLPAAADIGLSERMYSLYEKQCGISGTLERGQMRICPDCEGTGIKPRQRFCDNCTRKRRRKTQREYHKKYRAKSRGCA